MLIQSFQDVPFLKSPNSEFLSKLEREVDTKIVEFGKVVFFFLTIC